MRSFFVSAQKNYHKTDYSNGQLKEEEEEAWLGSNQKKGYCKF
jgi:hypothetical protein